MKASRRGFLGVLGGAAASGPAVAKQIAERLGGIGASMPPSSYVGNMAYASGLSGSAEGEVKYLQTELQDFVTRYAKIEDVKPRHERAWHLVECQRIDNLRSVSPINRARMMIEYQETIEKENQRPYWAERIDSLKKRLGVLGQFL